MTSQFHSVHEAFAETAQAYYPAPASKSTDYSVAFYSPVNRHALIAGLADRTMLRDEAKAFLDAGSYMESADMVLRILRVAFPPGDDDAERQRLFDAMQLVLRRLEHAQDVRRREIAFESQASSKGAARQSESI